MEINLVGTFSIRTNIKVLGNACYSESTFNGEENSIRNGNIIG